MSVSAENHRFRICVRSCLWLLLATVVLLFQPSVGNSQVEVNEFEDPDKQALYQQLIKELRCLVCQNQNLADSNADLAIDLRRRTRELIAQGKNHNQIAEYMVARYGEFVLYRPAFNLANLFLWLSPLILLVITIFLVVRSRKKAVSKDTAFSQAEHQDIRSRLQSIDDSNRTQTASKEDT